MKAATASKEPFTILATFYPFVFLPRAAEAFCFSFFL